MDPRSQAREHPRIGATQWVVLVALNLLASCARLPSPVLISADDRPALFLGSEPSAAQIGYLSDDVPLEITGRPREGRVPVRVEGALRTRGFVREDMLALRVQRRGRLRGTPVYVGPNDAVSVTGRAGKRLKVRARAQLRGQPFGPAYEGSYPREGLAAQAAPVGSLPPDQGTEYRVPASTAVPLFEAPNGPKVAELPAQPEPYPVRVVNQWQAWLAVRAGDGPYLIGWTNLPLSANNALAQLDVAAPKSNDALAAVNGVSLPARLANEPGELKRVAAGTKIVFGDAVIGVLKREGYARVVRAYDEAGYADVFVAVDDAVALRGLVRAVDLRDADANGTASPQAAR